MKFTSLAMTFLFLSASILTVHAATPAPAKAPEPQIPYTLNTGPIFSFFDRIASWPGKIFNTLDTWGQQWIIVFTRDPFDKAERSLNAANDKLEQATAIVQQADSPATLGSQFLGYLNRYTSFTDIAVSRIRELAQKNSTVEYQQLLQNYSLQQLKNQQSLRTLSGQAGVVADPVKQASERGLTQFAGILSDLDPAEVTKLINQTTLSQTDVSDLLAALDTLEQVKAKVPTALKTAVSQGERALVERLMKEAGGTANAILKQELPRLQKMLNDLR